MRADLQAILNLPPVSVGHESSSRDMVLAWLKMQLWAPNINFNLPAIASKVTALQGVNPDNMVDLQLYGLTRYLGYGNNTWAQIVPIARAAINGQGIQLTGVPIQTAVTAQDYQTIQNYALLTATKVINDAS